MLHWPVSFVGFVVMTHAYCKVETLVNRVSYPKRDEIGDKNCIESMKICGK